MRDTRPPERHRDSAGVIAPPPVLYVAGLIAGLLLQLLHRMPITSGASTVRQAVGALLMAIGLALSIAVMRVFGAAGTPVTPWSATRRLVSTGPYRYSRNPDYIGQTLLYVGIAVLANSWWPIFMLPLVLVILELGVIRREERYLEGKFGEEYRNYKARVRRWL